MQEQTAINWSGLVFDNNFMASVEKLAARRFGEGVLAEEAATYVIEYLSADEWRKCHGFQGKSQPKTFLLTLAANAIEEFSRKRFGRPRPPAWLQELGEMWVRLWRSLCLERQMLPAIVDRFARGGFREPEHVERAAQVIKARIPTCGQSARDSVGVDDIDKLSDAAQAEAGHDCDDPAEQAFENPFYAELLLMVRAITGSAPEPADFRGESARRCDQLAGGKSEQLRRLREAIALTDQETVMLRMIYVEGLSKTATSKALGLPAHQAGRLVNDVLQRIGGAMRECDIELDALLDIA